MKLLLRLGHVTLGLLLNHVAEHDWQHTQKSPSVLIDPLWL